MDVAYDHIQEEILSPEEANERVEQQGQGGGLNSEFQEAFKAVSASPWGAKLGGFFGQVKKQVCDYSHDRRTGCTETEMLICVCRRASRCTPTHRRSTAMPHRRLLAV